jgi:hypothetical protein
LVDAWGEAVADDVVGPAKLSLNGLERLTRRLVGEKGGIARRDRVAEALA